MQARNCECRVLNGRDVSDQDLVGSTFKGATLTNVHFNALRRDGALGPASLRGVSWQVVDLVEAVASFAVLPGADSPGRT